MNAPAAPAKKPRRAAGAPPGYERMKALAERLGFAESTLYGWLSNPELKFPPAVKLGRNVSLYCTAAVDKWLSDRTNAALAGVEA